MDVSMTFFAERKQRLRQRDLPAQGPTAAKHTGRISTQDLQLQNPVLGHCTAWWIHLLSLVMGMEVREDPTHMTHPPPALVCSTLKWRCLWIERHILGLLEGLGVMWLLERGGCSRIREQEVRVCM